MAEANKQNKQRKSVTLKPINVKWLAEKSLELSTPEEKISDSELIDRLIDQARESESQSPSKQKKTTARAVELVLAI